MVVGTDPGRGSNTCRIAGRMTCRHPHASEARRELRGTTFARLVSLKQRWHVSIAFLIRQAFDLGLIDDRTRTWFYIQSGQQPGGRRREPAEFAPEEPTLARCLIESLNSDGLSIAEIANVATRTRTSFGSSTSVSRHAFVPRATVRREPCCACTVRTRTGRDWFTHPTWVQPLRDGEVASEWC